jgi:hypothetical protein
MTFGARLLDFGRSSFSNQFLAPRFGDKPRLYVFA